MGKQNPTIKLTKEMKKVLDGFAETKGMTYDEIISDLVEFRLKWWEKKK